MVRILCANKDVAQMVVATVFEQGKPLSLLEPLMFFQCEVDDQCMP